MNKNSEPADSAKLWKWRFPDIVHFVLTVVGIGFAAMWAPIGFFFARTWFLLLVLVLVGAQRFWIRRRLRLWVCLGALGGAGLLSALGAFNSPLMSGCRGVETWASYRSCPRFPNGAACRFRHFNPYEIVVDAERSWVFFSIALGRHAILRFDLDRPDAPPVYVETPPDSVTQRMIMGLDGLLYAGGNDFEVHVIDPETMEIKYELSINDQFGSGFDMDPDTGLIYLVVMDNSVCVIDPPEIAPRCSRVDTWYTLYDIAVDPGRRAGYLTSWAPGRIYKFDLDTLEVTGEVRAGVSALGVEIDPERGLVYVARPFLGRVHVLDAETLEHVRDLRAGFGVRRIALSPDGRHLLAGNYFARNVTLVDTQSGALIWKKHVGAQVRDVRLVETERGFTAWAVSRCGLIRHDIELP